MKKLFAVAIAAALLLLCACGEAAPETPNAETVTQENANQTEQQDESDLLAEEWKQLLINKATFDELKDIYGLEKRWDEDEFLFASSNSLPKIHGVRGVEFNFTKDWDTSNVYRLDLYSFEFQEQDVLSSSNSVTVCEIATYETTKRNGRVADMVNAQAKQLLADKPSFDEIKQKYDLEIDGESPYFLYTKIKTMPDVEFNFMKDALNTFRLMNIAAPASVLIPEYVRMPRNELPFTLYDSTYETYLMYDGKYTYFVKDNYPSRVRRNCQSGRKRNMFF